MTITHSDILIVGAGPIGLLLALLLHKQGVEVTLVERQKALYPLPRAVVCDHEARRLLGSAGLGEELDAILEDVIGQGGEDGTNFVWRDADLKRKSQGTRACADSSGRRPWVGSAQRFGDGLLLRLPPARA